MGAVRIVIIRSNPVNPDSRVEKVSTTLSNCGYKVKILCWDREYTHGELVSKLADERVEIIRLGYKASFGEGMKNIVPYLRFQMAMRRWLKKHKNEYDLVHACDFDTAFFSLGVAKMCRKKFIFDIFDFICGEAKTIFQRLIKKLQYKIISKADATIICNEDRKKQIIGSNPKRLAVIHNSPPRIESKTRRINQSECKIVYVGILSNNRLLKEEVEVFKKHNDWVFLVGGFGLHEEYFKEAAKRYNNIKYYGKIAYDKTIALESEADIMLAIYDPSIENHRFAAPNKFYEALMLGKPLIMVKETGMSTEVQNNDIGVVIDYTSEGFERGIEELLSRKSEWSEMAIRMKDLYNKQYSWEIMEQRLTDLYKEVLGDNE